MAFQNYVIDDEKTFDENRRLEIAKNLKSFDKVMTFSSNIGDKNQKYFRNYLLVKSTFEMDLLQIRNDSEKYIKIIDLYKQERKKFTIKQNMSQDIYKFKTKYHVHLFNKDREFESLCKQRILEHAHWSSNNNVFVVYARSYNLSINRLIKSFIDLLDKCLESRRLKLWVIVSNQSFYVNVPKKYETSIVFFETDSYSNFYVQHATYYINLENPTGFTENNIVFAKNIGKPIINISDSPIEDYLGIMQIKPNRYYIYDDLLSLLIDRTNLFDHIKP
jgi:hypothetical protein